jgi:hypothetical protein
VRLEVSAIRKSFGKPNQTGVTGRSGEHAQVLLKRTAEIVGTRYIYLEHSSSGGTMFHQIPTAGFEVKTSNHAVRPEK